MSNKKNHRRRQSKNNRGRGPENKRQVGTWKGIPGLVRTAWLWGNGYNCPLGLKGIAKGRARWKKLRSRMERRTQRIDDET